MSSKEEKKEKKEKKSKEHKEKKEKKEKKTKDTKDVKETKEEVKQEKKEIEESVSETSETESALDTPKPSATDTTITDDDDEEEHATEADDLLEQNKDAEKVLSQIQQKKEKVILKEKSFVIRKAKLDEDYDENIPWYGMRDCILLVLQARMMLKDMITLKLKKERIRAGELSVSEIQDLLRSQKEDEETDWVTEIQELKRNLVSEVRRNHSLERELGKLDKRIALLIKNRGNIQEVLAQGGGKKKPQVVEKAETFGGRKLEHYQNLFYLLQTEPKYLANLVYLIKSENMESFLDTVILTLYGDAFSPREEYLILKLFQLAIQKEMSATSNVSDFLKADSVVPKLVITYNRRKQGLEFLKNIIGPTFKQVIQKDINLELKPNMIYQSLINEQEIRTGEKSTMKRDLTEDQIMELPEVKAIVNARLDQLKQISEQFFETIIKNINKLPYGIRWICKQISKIAKENFKNSSEDDILKVTGYFVYYRFINLAIVTPDAFEIYEKELTPVARKNLVTVSRVLQNLFNLSLFVGANDKWVMPLNDWLKSKLDTVRDYFTDLAEVAEPEDYLQVDRYMELFQKTKPVIIISLHEISQTHMHLQQNLEKLAKDKEDPLRLIIQDLGDAPSISKNDDREIQLTLTNRFKQNVEEEITSASNVYMETKEQIINSFRHIPMQASTKPLSLIEVLQGGKKFATEQSNTALAEQIEKILENIKILENEGLVSKADDYATFLKDIALEVANRAEIREQQRKEIKRLNQTLRSLRKHQKYITDQIQQYRDYLEDARLKHYQAHQKKKKKVKEGENPNKMGPFKFSYSALAKKGVILDSEVPTISRKKTTFEISSETVGVFDIVAKIAGVPVEKMTLELDDLLERNYNNINSLELDQVTLDVNMTIHLLNKFFMK